MCGQSLHMLKPYILKTERGMGEVGEIEDGTGKKREKRKRREEKSRRKSEGRKNNKLSEAQVNVTRKNNLN